MGRILCKPCNADFGKQFEKPISDLYAAGRFRDPDVQELIYRWAIKTALTLATMSNIEYPPWLWKIVDGHRAPPTLHMFHILIPAPPDPGYVHSDGLPAVHARGVCVHIHIRQPDVRDR